IPNRTVKRLRANDSAATSVKVGYRQAFIPQTPAQLMSGGFAFARTEYHRVKQLQERSASSMRRVRCAHRSPGAQAYPDHTARRFKQRLQAPACAGATNLRLTLL
ncbi:hypothetical protein, partial [Undibacterium sp. Ji49W]|uniref:hypothetical protein n=1 Tax=Undibacterium sp. Ji49W TaxID=3413040 RepID=UPI003BF2BF00